MCTTDSNCCSNNVSCCRNDVSSLSSNFNPSKPFEANLFCSRGNIRLKALEDVAAILRQEMEQSFLCSVLSFPFSSLSLFSLSLFSYLHFPSFHSSLSFFIFLLSHLSSFCSFLSFLKRILLHVSLWQRVKSLLISFFPPFSLTFSSMKFLPSFLLRLFPYSLSFSL